MSYLLLVQSKLSMVVIDLLPSELLDRIWTIAVEVPLDLHVAIELNYECKTCTLKPH